MDKTPIYIINDVYQVIGVIPPTLMKQFNMGNKEQTTDSRRYYVTEEQLVASLI